MAWEGKRVARREASTWRAKASTVESAATGPAKRSGTYAREARFCRWLRAGAYDEVFNVRGGRKKMQAMEGSESRKARM